MVRPSADCVAPEEIEAGDLVAFAQGEAGPSVTQHVDHCPACRGEAESFAGMQRLLTTKLFRQTCPPSLTIGEYAAELLPPEQRLVVAQHLAECHHCRDERRAFSAFLAEPDERIAQPSLVGVLRRIVATRLEALAPALNGLRGTSTSESISYDAEGTRLTMSVQRSTRGSRGSVIVGLLQLDLESLDGSRVELFAGSQLLQAQDVDDLGNFLFEGVPTGTYRVEVTVPESVIVVDSVEVSA